MQRKEAREKVQRADHDTHKERPKSTRSSLRVIGNGKKKTTNGRATSARVAPPHWWMDKEAAASVLLVWRFIPLLNLSVRKYTATQMHAGQHHPIRRRRAKWRSRAEWCQGSYTLTISVPI